MAQPTDATLPILQRIQSDLTDLKGDHKEHRAHTTTNSETLAAIQHHFYRRLGMTTKNEADVETVQKELRDSKERLSALEARS